MKDEFYTVRGWDVATGFQTREVLEKLGLSDISDRLEKAGLIAWAQFHSYTPTVEKQLGALDGKSTRKKASFFLTFF